MKNSLFIGMSFMVLAGCAEPMAGIGKTGDTDISGDETVVRPQARPENAVRPVAENARTIEEFDTTTQAERIEAIGTADGAGKLLGKTVASLGDPTQPGFWLKTPLVQSDGKGRVEYPATGKAVEVDLIAIDGPGTAGSQISLAAMRLLGAPLTGLPEFLVYAQ